jgi:superoxide dismutase, Fe-Mn family
MKFINFLGENKNKLYQQPLPYNRSDLEPAISEATIDYHFDGLAAKYVKRYNKGEGDPKFNYGGAILHNIYFAQFCEPDLSNYSGIAKAKINREYGSLDGLKKIFEEKAMKIQGSGWVYLDYKMNVNVIHNHEYDDKMIIVLLIDWWEHAWALDYQADKQEYLKNIWSIINWNVISDRLL